MAIKVRKAVSPKKTNGDAPTLPITVRVSTVVPDGTPSYYANYLEVGHTKWDFSLIIGRIPVKHSRSKLEEMRTTGVLSLDAELQINFPPTLIAGLIRALTVQKEKFEKDTGMELKDTANGNRPKSEPEK